MIWLYLFLPPSVALWVNVATEAFAVIGATFTFVLMTGLLVNGRQSGVALDQWIGTCIIVGHKADETISAWAHRNHHKRTEALINWLFRDPKHCSAAYIAEMDGEQNAPEYKKG
jgi:hypothetical protein